MLININMTASLPLPNIVI